MLPNLDLYNRLSAEQAPDKFHQRAKWHDYRSKCIYMITIKKMPGIPDLSIISGRIDNGKAYATNTNTQLGAIICKALRELPVRFPGIRTLQYIIMPDHAHLLLEATRPLPYHISDAIRVFKQDCTSRYADALLSRFNFNFDGKVFADGFHDRILTGKNQLSALIGYIRDNPRRLFLKRQFPEAFRNHLSLILPDAAFSVYGNPLLLESPWKYPVRFSSKFTETDLNKKKNTWAEAVRNGSVIVSPFIHPVEKTYLDAAISQGGNAIIIRDNGFPERWKPEKKYFDACAQGRILFVAPEEFHTHRQDLTRAMCMHLNYIAERISSLTPGSYKLRRK